jgi:hypothetical protein
MFTGDSHDVLLDSSSTAKTWNILPAVSGTVTLYGVVNGREQTATTRITVTDCALFASAPTDTLLLNPVVQATLIDLAHRTHWDGPVEDRKEYGGYFVQYGGAIEFHEYQYLSGMPTACNSNHLEERDSFGTGTLLMEGHTHPFINDTIDNTNGLCPERARAILRSEDGPSRGSPHERADLTDWQQDTNPKPYPGIVIDRRHLHWWKSSVDGSGHRHLDQQQFDLNTGSDRCVL